MGTCPKEYQYAYPIILSLKNESYIALKIAAQGLAACQKCNQALAFIRTLTSEWSRNVCRLGGLLIDLLTSFPCANRNEGIKLQETGSNTRHHFFNILKKSHIHNSADLHISFAIVLKLQAELQNWALFLYSQYHHCVAESEYNKLESTHESFPLRVVYEL